jgi:hypothetical protein
MAYNPQTQDMRPQILMQGANDFSQAMGNATQGIANAFREYEQNKHMAAQATGKFEGAIKANPELLKFLDPDNPSPNAPTEAVRAFSKLRRDGTLALKDAALLSTFADSYASTKQEVQMAQLRQMQADKLKNDMAQQAKDASAFTAAFNLSSPQGAMADAINRNVRFENLPTNGAPLNIERFMGEYFKQGGSPAGIDRVDAVVKMMAPTGRSEDTEALKKGYRVLPGGNWQPIQGGPADPAVQQKREAQPFQRGNSYADKDGKFIGVSSFDQRTGREILTTPDGKTTAIPEGAKPITPTALNETLPDWKEFTKLRTDIIGDERSLREFSRYMGGVKDVSTGLDQLADRFSKNFKTLVGDTGLTSKEIALALSQGRLQGLVGATRLSTLGPGPVTEQDAMRLIQRLGGDVSALTNKAIVKRLLGELYSDRYEQYQNNLAVYNDAFDRRYNQSPQFKRAVPLQFDPDFVDTKHYSDAVAQPTPAVPAWDSNAEKRMRELEAKSKGKKG